MGGLTERCPSCDINLSLTSSKFLNCLHAYCSHCLRKMENRLRCLSGQNNRSGSLNRRSNNNAGHLGNILCPKCHTLSPLSIRYGIDKLISSNFAYQPSSITLSGSADPRDVMSQHRKQIELKLTTAHRCKGEAALRKSRFLLRVNEARDYLDRFVAQANGSFDLKRLSLLKQIQKIRLRVTNYLVSKIILLEQLEIDLQYLLDLANLLKDRTEGFVEDEPKKTVLDHRRSAAPVLYTHKPIEQDLQLSSSPMDNRFSLATHSIVRKEDEVNFEEILSGSILPFFKKRFESLTNTLNDTLNSMEEDVITLESLSENPRIVYLPENYTLFEKVVCEIPILIVDGNNVPIVGSHHLQEMTSKFMFGNQQSLPVELEESGGLFKLRFVPPKSGCGQIVIKYHRSKVHLMTTPTRFEIKPLLLDFKNNTKLKTVAI